ncbi:hypothetical protein IFO70_32725 [Phormidium tenue FACHB-886]|nr:hypothetical protein [Phormidium tenue FACHB-886]
MANYDRQIQEIEQKMQPNGNQSAAQPKQPQAKRPNPSPDRAAAQVKQVRQESQGAIAVASQGIVGSAAQSVQKLDQQLSDFEDRYVATVQQRIAEVPARIEAKLAAALAWGQEGINPLDSVAAEIEAWEVPDISLPAEQFLFGAKTASPLPASELLK